MFALLVVLVFGAGAAGSSAGGGRSTASLDLYTGVVSSETLGRLVRQGYDIADARPTAGGVQADLVLTEAEVAKLGAQGVAVHPRRDTQGRTQAKRAAEQAAGGFNVWRSYDAPGGIRDELYRIAQRNSHIVKLEVIGHTLQGREIIALKVTTKAKKVADGTRPDVLYMSTIHAREWISTEVNRRLLHYFVDNYGKKADVTNLVNTSELWFLVVANPDGYQYTFDHQRLWRKNLHDNDGDGQFTGNDGVDLNRNYDVDWGYDNEGSSTQFSADDYRGTGPASEPETRAHQALIDRLKFKFLITYHSYGPLILYPFGWQVQTPSADDPLYVAYSGIDATPAISGFDPGVGGRPVHHERHHRRLLVREDRRAVVDGRAERGLRRLRVRVPRRRVARAGRVREEPAVRARPREVGGEPGAARSRTWATRSSPSTSTWARTGRPRTGPTRRRRTTPRSTSRSPSRTATRSLCGCSPSAT